MYVIISDFMFLQLLTDAIGGLDSSDVTLITSLWDGMNLVSSEFVACQDSKRGVLILSEVIYIYATLHYA